MKPRWGLNRINVLRYLEIPGLSNSTTGILEQKKKKSERKVQGVPQSQTAALPRHQEEKETDKTKQAQIEQTYEKHQDWLPLPQAR